MKHLFIFKPVHFMIHITQCISEEADNSTYSRSVLLLFILFLPHLVTPPGTWEPYCYQIHKKQKVKNFHQVAFYVMYQFWRLDKALTSLVSLTFLKTVLWHCIFWYQIIKKKKKKGCSDGDSATLKD